jgi:magnesium-transporting ATPase (P-type)
VSPEQKQAIVATQQRSGHFVAVTGDGVNDAPALKTANIGVAMGYGTDVAKETASIIITDNNFASIEAGIEEGRFTYANIRKIIYLLISCGAAELLMIALALIMGTPLPFLPAQILWLNLVTNGIQDKVLAFEKGEPELMEVPPRDPKEAIFNPLMIKQTITAAITMALLSFGLWYHLLYNLNYSEESARNISLLLMVLLQNFHVLNARSESKSIFKIPLKNNKWLFVGILGAQGIHILAMYVPFMQNLLSLEPVSIEKWGYLFLTASIILVVMEGFKMVMRKNNTKTT